MKQAYFLLLVILTGLVYSGCTGYSKKEPADNLEKLPGASLTATNDLYRERTISIMDSLAHLYVVDPIRLKTIWGNAKTATILSDSMYFYLQDIKEKLAAKANGWTNQAKTTVDHDEDLSISQDFFIKRDGGKKGIELRNKLESFDKRMSSLAIDRNGNPVRIEFGIDSQEEKKDRNGNKIPWHIYYFQDVPAIAAITEITKFQNDVRNAEGEVIDLLYKEAKKAR